MNINYQLKYDGSEEDIKWLMWFARWSRQIAINALKQWAAVKHRRDVRATLPDNTGRI